MQMNAAYILGGQQPDALNILSRSNEAAQQRIGFDRQNAIAQLYQTQGPGIAAGETEALNALAQFDPQASLGIQEQRLGMQATQQRMDILTREEQRRVQQEAAQMSAAERQSQAEQIERAVASGLAARNPQEWDAMMSQTAPDLVGQFDQREMLAARYMSIADILKRQDAMAQPPTPFSPEGKLYADEQRGLVPPGTAGRVRDPAAEQKVARLMETGIDRETAIGIADGRFVVSQLGEVIDKVTGQPIQPPAETQSSPAPTVPDADYGSAFGPTGVVANTANIIADAFGRDLPAPETRKAHTALTNVALRTVTTMQKSFPGRASVQLMQKLEQIAARPANFFSGA